ncbi:MAG: dihydrofolate reductase family protein, partial [Candidatus Woesebacteria bacterium]|nr:dihydrofolate reductase family protein [Candidatus Woesebacteria bacterium]
MTPRIKQKHEKIPSRQGIREHDGGVDQSGNIDMKVILYMAITANGLIAREEGGTDWINQEDWKNFREMAKQAGSVVMGRGTYDAMIKEGEFPVAGVLNVVMTREAPPAEPLKEVIFSDASPEEVVGMLGERGFESVLIAGGGNLNGSFMGDGLIDEIYLTIEPVVFGQGIQLFEHADFE